MWRVGGVVLEEYSTEKATRSRSGHRARTRAFGRGDMAFRLGRRDYVIEAKQCWPRLGRPGALTLVRESLVAALGDVRRAYAEPGTRRLAVVFAAPRTPRLHAMRAELAEWIAAAGSFSQCARAWVFPAAGRKLVSEKNGRVYPGAAIFLKALNRV